MCTNGSNTQKVWDPLFGWTLLNQQSLGSQVLTGFCPPVHIPVISTWFDMYCTTVEVRRLISPNFKYVCYCYVLLVFCWKKSNTEPAKNLRQTLLGWTGTFSVSLQHQCLTSLVSKKEQISRPTFLNLMKAFLSSWLWNGTFSNRILVRCSKILILSLIVYKASLKAAWLDTITVRQSRHTLSGGLRVLGKINTEKSSYLLQLWRITVAVQ